MRKLPESGSGGGGDPSEFIALYRSAYNFLVDTRGLDNLLFVYEPSGNHATAPDYYPGDQYVDIVGISLFVDYDRELSEESIPNYGELKKLGNPMALSRWGPRRGRDQTGTTVQPPADNLKLIRGIMNAFPEIVWWMNWNYAYSKNGGEKPNTHDRELLEYPWVISPDEIDWRKK